MTKRERNKLTGAAVIACCLLMIVTSIWGINKSFDLAKENRQHLIRQLSANTPLIIRANLPQTINAALPTDRNVQYQLQSMGLDANPHFFNEGLRKIMGIFTLCLLLATAIMCLALFKLNDRPALWINSNPDDQDDIKVRIEPYV